MSGLLIFVAVCVGPAAVIWVLDRAFQIWTGTRPWPGWAGRRRPETATCSRPSIERMTGDLAWLAEEMNRIQHGNQPAKAHRLAAVGLAYDDTLRMCGQALDIPTPVERELTGQERLELEAALALAGLTW